MTQEDAFILVSETANCSKDIGRLKSKRPTKDQLQYALESMITNGVRLDIAREALWAIEEYFDNDTRGKG